MRITIVGIKDTRFTNKETGEVITGQSIHFEYCERNVHGFAVDRCFLSEVKKLKQIPDVPCEADLFYNKYGKVDEIIVR